MNRYVIVGNGVAAVGCIEGIRSLDPAGKITVVSAEGRPAYCRPLISYYLEGKADIARMDYRAPSFYENAGCRVLYGQTALKLNAKEKTLALDTGKTLSYTSVCVAAGSSPFVPPMDGLEAVSNKFTFLTLDDALSLERAITPTSRVLIVGAGLIGLKCAEGIYKRVKSIAVCDLADRVLGSILTVKDAAAVQAHLEAKGLRFYLGNTVKRLEENRAFLQNGEEVPFDLLVLAVGVRPNAALVREAGGEVGRGIVVDDGMRTSLPDVFAAGDCAEGTDASTGQKRVLAILPNAYMQGYTAGVNMAGGQAAFSNAVPMNSIGFFGLHMMTAGAYTGEASREETENGSKTFFTENGFLKGFILIGQTERAGIYTSLIRERIPLDQVDFELLKKTATSAAFTKTKRENMFAGGMNDGH